MPQPCARRAHKQPPTEQHSTIVGRIYPIQMYTPQTNNTPQLLAEHIQYKYISLNMYMPQLCARRAHRQPPAEQYCVFVFSDMTPQNIIVDIPVLSYYPKDSMCLCYSPLEVCTFVFVYLYFVGNGLGCTL